MERELNASFPYTVMSVLLYGAETWPVVQAEIRRLRTFQMRCLWDTLGLILYVGLAKKCRHFEARASARGEAAEVKMTAMARSCTADA